jgi:hypothetical protein
MRARRAGDTVEDVCRACKLDRMHTVIAADPNGVPVRVQCDYCGSQHQYRGGPAAPSGEAAGPLASAAGGARRPASQSGAPARAPFPIVSGRERSAEPFMQPADSGAATAGPAPDHPNDMTDRVDLELLIRRIIREEAGVTAVVPAEKWRGGTLVLKPAQPGLQEKSWPVESLFHKIVMIRNRLRTLEQQVNASDLPEDAKIRLQAYITGCYGSLTSFNVLFADEGDQFKGTGGD